MTRLPIFVISVSGKDHSGIAISPRPVSSATSEQAALEMYAEWQKSPACIEKYSRVEMYDSGWIYCDIEPLALAKAALNPGDVAELWS